MSMGQPNQSNYQSFFFLPSKYLNNTNTHEISYDEFCYHPCQIANFIIHVSKMNKYNKYKLLKWIATATFCHPVLISYAEKAINSILDNQALFDLIGNENTQIYG